jgi:hypothetical protein
MDTDKVLRQLREVASIDLDAVIKSLETASPDLVETFTEYATDARDQADTLLSLLERQAGTD